MKPAGVTDEAWAEARAKAGQDRHTLARLVRSGRVRRDGSRTFLPLPQPVDPTIRPNKKKRGKRK